MNSALIVIDVQESFRQRENWAVVSNPDIVGQVNKLVEATRAAGDLVVWVLHSEPGSGTVFDPALGHVRPIEGLLEPLDGEPTIYKTSHNAFTTTNLQQQLTEHGVRELVISGIRTEQCCETTTRVGSDLGYQVTFVTDATATHPIEHRDAPAGRTLAEIMADPLTLTTDQVITRTEYALAGRFARVATVEELTGS
ncbi:isochorismatase family protein [Kitasatospora sp. NPDC002040]|uniref:cysteine hydrolase family protein n=1 Tax=Kitasatospora sp. NPDC002040 TaxID=3154661 RepID=UPI00332D4C3F